MGNPFRTWLVDNADGNLQNGMTLPVCPDEDFHFKLKASCLYAHVQGFGKRVQSHAALAVEDFRPAGEVYP